MKPIFCRKLLRNDRINCLIVFKKLSQSQYLCNKMFQHCVDTEILERHVPRDRFVEHRGRMMDFGSQKPQKTVTRSHEENDGL